MKLFIEVAFLVIKIIVAIISAILGYTHLTISQKSKNKHNQIMNMLYVLMYLIAFMICTT